LLCDFQVSDLLYCKQQQAVVSHYYIITEFKGSRFLYVNSGDKGSDSKHAYIHTMKYR
jgi:hypothetical protein